MLAKLSSKNQVAIPKELLEQLEFADPREERYVDIIRRNGHLIATPVNVTIEERYTPEEIEKLRKYALQRHPGDKYFRSAEAATAYLKRLMRRRRSR